MELVRGGVAGARRAHNPEVPGANPGPATTLSPATEKCALATQAAYRAVDRSERALELVAAQLEHLRRQSAIQVQLEGELIKTEAELKQSIRELNRMAAAFVERMPPARGG